MSRGWRSVAPGPSRSDPARSASGTPSVFAEPGDVDTSWTRHRESPLISRNSWITPSPRYCGSHIVGLARRGRSGPKSKAQVLVSASALGPGSSEPDRRCLHRWRWAGSRSVPSGVSDSLNRAPFPPGSSETPGQPIPPPPPPDSPGLPLAYRAHVVVCNDVLQRCLHVDGPGSCASSSTKSGDDPSLDPRRSSAINQGRDAARLGRARS